MVEKNKRILLILILIIFINFSLKKRYDFFKAKNLYIKGKYKRALLLYSQYLKENKRDEILHYNIATIYLKLKKNREAEDYFKKVINESKIKIIKKRALFNLAYLMFYKGDKVKALQLFKKSAIIDPQDLLCKKNIEILLKEDENKKNKKRRESKKDKKTKGKLRREDTQILNFIKDAEKISLKNFLNKKNRKEKREKDW